MPRAHHWHGIRILLAWVAAGSMLVLVRWTLLQGVYRVSVQDQRVLRDGGLWPASFATFVTVVVAALVFMALSWVTLTWFTGRRQRAAARTGAIDVHRRILM